MYTGNNPSALRSKEWLRKALLQLLTEKKYSQIHIKDICERATLSRQTIYQMFSSKDEIMEYHFSILFHQFTEYCSSYQNISVFEISQCFFTFFRKHRDFIDILITNNLTHLLERQFEYYLTQINLFNKYNKNNLHTDYTVAFLSGALTQILIHWLQSNCNLTVDEISSLTQAGLTGAVFHL